VKCKHCGTKIEAGERYCPGCGVNIEAEASPQAEEVTKNAAIEAEKPVAAPRRRSRAPVVVAALVLAAVTAGGFIFSAAPKGSGTVVATWRGKRLTQQMLDYYYWDEANNYASYGYVDLSQPLVDQPCEVPGYDNWHLYFVDAAVDSWATFAAMRDAAETAGHTIDPGFVEYLDALPGSIAEAAASAGVADADALLQQDYGEDANLTDYTAYITDYLWATSYAEEIYDDMLAENDAGLDMVDSVNVRHILFLTGTDDDAAVKAQAEEIYARWQKTGGEETFAALAAKYTADGNGDAGGLYEGVYPGQMVQAFNDWCFDPARQIGDSGIVETEFGYHIMYFSGWGEPVPADAAAGSASEEAAGAAFDAWIDDLVGEAAQIDYDRITQN
jgi:uncharacterized OB-fold protein